MQRLGRTLSLIVVAVAIGVLSGCLFQTPPRAEFTATPESAYPPIEVTFDASASSSSNGLIVNYAWDFGDGEIGSGITAKHTYAVKGIYGVVLEVSDSAGKAAGRTKNIEALNRAPVARFLSNVSLTGSDQPVWFNASESYDPDGEVVQYIWDFGDGTSAEGVLIEHTYRDVGGRSRGQLGITLTVVDEDGAKDSVTKHITVIDSCND
jgi:PKD repeat protein